MKKIITLVLALAVISSGAFAKKWTNNIGFGINSAFSSMSVDDTDIDQTGFGLGATYVGIHENGFCVKVDETVGVASSKDFSMDEDDDESVGTYTNLTLGAGWGMIKDEKLTFTATAMLGFDFATYEYSHSLNNVDYDNQTNFLTFSLGADVFASYRIKEHFGIYADLGIYYYPAGFCYTKSDVTTEEGNTKTTVSTDNDEKISGTYRVSPTIGIVWNF